MSEQHTEIAYTGEERLLQVYHLLRDGSITDPQAYEDLPLDLFQIANQLHNCLKNGGVATIDAQFEALKGAHPALRKTPDIYLIDQARKSGDPKEINKIAPELAKMSPVDCENLIIDIKAEIPKVNVSKLNSFIKDARAEQKQASTSDFSIQERNDLEYIAKLFEERYGDNWAYDKHQQCWRKWLGTHWSKLENDNEVKSELDSIFVDLLHEEDKDSNTIQSLEYLHRRVKGKCGKRKFTNTKGLVNFTNGTLVVNLKKYCVVELREWDKEDNLTSCVGYDYCVGPFPHITRFFEESQPDSFARDAFKAILGLALLQDTSVYQYLFLYGRTKAGKSTWLRLANAVCGYTSSQYKSSAAENLFASGPDGDWARALQRDRLLLIADELKPETFRDCEGMIKKITAFDGVPMRNFHEKGTTDNQWTARLIMSANEMPHFKDIAGALAERTVVLYFPHTKPLKDRVRTMFEESLLPEIGPFAAECIAYGLTLLQQGYLPKSLFMLNQSRQISTDNNPLRRFIQDKCALLTGAPEGANPEDFEIPSETLHQAYKADCDSTLNKALSAPRMTIELKEMDIGVTTSGRAVYNKEIKKNGQRLYGIRLKKDDERDKDFLSELVGDDPLQVSLDKYLTSPTYIPNNPCDCAMCEKPHTSNVICEVTCEVNESASQASSWQKPHDITDKMEFSSIEKLCMHLKSEIEKETGYTQNPIQINLQKLCEVVRSCAVTKPVEPVEAPHGGPHRENSTCEVAEVREVVPDVFSDLDEE